MSGGGYARLGTAALALALCLAGCGGRRESSGIVTAGSTSMDHVMGALAEQYGLDHPETAVSVEGGGSSAGIEAAANGSADIGLSSRALKEGEKARGLTETVLALDGIAVIVSDRNPVDSLTVDQLAAIYTGECVNWAEVGGADIPIAAVGRESGSGTRDGFEAATGAAGSRALSQELTSTGAVIEAVRGNAYGCAIGYASLSAVEGQPGIKTIAVDGVPCTEETVLDGSYPIQRPFMLVTKTSGAMPETVQEFFRWAVSMDAAQLIRNAGAIPAAGQEE